LDHFGGSGGRTQTKAVPWRAFTASAENKQEGGFVEQAAASAKADAMRTAPFPSFGRGLVKLFATCSRAQCHFGGSVHGKRRDFGPRTEHRKHNASSVPASTPKRACPQRSRRLGKHLFGGANRNRRHDIVAQCNQVALPRKYTRSLRTAPDPRQLVTAVVPWSGAQEYGRPNARSACTARIQSGDRKTSWLTPVLNFRKTAEGESLTNRVLR